MKIAITPSSFATHSDEPLKMFEAAGIEITANPHGRVLTADEAMAILKECDGVLAGTEPLGARVLEALPRLKAISRLGVGLDNVDLEFARSRGISVRNTPDGPTRAVAEVTVGVILDLLRHISRQDREMRGGVWKKRMGNLLLGKRVGMVGMGRIGQATAGLLTLLGAEVAYSDPCRLDLCHACMDLDALLGWADIVSLHCSKPSCTGPLIGARELGLMRPGTWLVNLARGGLLDEDALAAALASGRLAGAALDCFAKEPYAGPLAGLDNVVLTPHIGSYAVEGRIKMELDAARNLLEALGGKP
jgi:D-3-phosphoglycerate dehydrogenase